MKQCPVFLANGKYKEYLLFTILRHNLTREYRASGSRFSHFLLEVKTENIYFLWKIGAKATGLPVTCTCQKGKALG